MRLFLRFCGFLFAAGTIVFLVSIGAGAGLLWHFSKDLPDYSQLQDYEPPVMTRVHATDGALVAEYATQRRLYIPIQAVPKMVINAFLAAEDKNFYDHNGLDFQGIARAGTVYLQNYGCEPAAAGRLDHHAAGRQELPADQRGLVHPQDQGGAARAQDRADLFQGQDPRALSQRDLSRLQRLRHRRGVADVLRQVGARAHHPRGRLPRRAAEGAEHPASVPRPRARDRAAQLRDRPDGPHRRGQAGRRRQVQERAADRHRKADRLAYLCRRLFRRRGAPLDLRQVRREDAVRRRPVGPHHARPQAAGAGAHRAGGRPHQVRRGAGLARSGAEAQAGRRLGREAVRGEAAQRRRAVAALRWCWRPATSRRRSGFTRRASRAARSARSARPVSCRSTR